MWNQCTNNAESIDAKVAMIDSPTTRRRRVPICQPTDKSGAGSERIIASPPEPPTRPTTRLHEPLGEEVQSGHRRCGDDQHELLAPFELLHQEAERNAEKDDDQ